jgi:endoglucanase
MSVLRRLALLVLVIAGSVIVPATAQADTSGFHLQSSQLYVHEAAGQAVVTIVRGDTSRDAQIRYITGGLGFDCGGTQCTATQYDTTGVKGMLDFPPGVASESFTVPVVDHAADSLSKTIAVSLFGAYPIGLSSPSKAVLTILNDDSPVAHDTSDPLGVPGGSVANPLAGANFFVDPDSAPAHAARTGHPLINVIARQPGTSRYGTFSWPNAGIAVSNELAKAQVLQPGSVPMLATYRLVGSHCGQWADPPADQQRYHDFIENFAQGIGDYRAVLFLEEDSLITIGCLTPHGVAVRMAELHDAINILTANCPRLVIYLDAGAGDAVSVGKTAQMLRQAGGSQIAGFCLNSTHFDWTSREIQFGEAVSRLTGGKHFVVNTGDNGRGPLVPADRVHQGNEVLCNPAGRGLGPVPTTSTGYPNVDAFAWTTNPGESGGRCVPGAPATGAYWPAYAEMLIRNAVFHVDSAFNPLAPFGGATRATPAKPHKTSAHKAKPHKAPAHKAKKAHKPAKHHQKKRRHRK